MIESLKTTLQDWNRMNNDRTKLQHAYFITAFLVLLVAGLASLINSALGQTLLMVTTALAVIFFANAIAWALLQSFVLQRLGRNRTTRK